MIQQFLAAALTVSFVASPLAQAAPAPEYGIKEDRPRTGSMIRRQMVGPVAIPVHLSYDQLSPEDRAKFNTNYENVAPGDEPPFPTGGLKTILDPLRKAQASLLVEGDLFLVAKVDSSGVPQEVVAYGSPSPAMTQLAARILLLTKFKPAVCGGQPCAMEFPLRILFKLE